MLQAMNTGHDGSLTTAHANTPRDCLSRLEVMTLMSGLEIPVQAIQVLPYVLTIILLAGFIGRAVAPKASGLPYTKER